MTLVPSSAALEVPDSKCLSLLISLYARPPLAPGPESDAHKSWRPRLAHLTAAGARGRTVLIILRRACGILCG
jgi:hypothetical protein